MKVTKETRTLRRIEKSISHILSLHIKVGYCNVVLDCFHYYVHYVLYVDMMVICRYDGYMIYDMMVI